MRSYEQLGKSKAPKSAMMDMDAEGIEYMAPVVDTNLAEAYGCLFCVTGKECSVAKSIELALPNVRALVAKQEKPKSKNGYKQRIRAIMLPGYVFFKAPRDIDPVACFPKENVIRVLTVDRDIWQLMGADERFVNWLFAYGGLLGFSKAYKEGEHIRIVSGPLKDMEGLIKKIDKRCHSGQVVIHFSGKAIPIWLGFDLIEELPPV